MAVDNLRYFGTTGWYHPYEITSEGETRTSNYSESIYGSLLFIVETRKGEIFMKPHLGTRLYELIFMPIDEVFYALAKDYLMTDIRQQEQRVENVRIIFKEPLESSEQNMVIIEIQYTEKKTRSKGVVRFTFSPDGRILGNE